MKQLISNAIQRRLEELERGNTATTVKEELVSEATNRLVNSSRIDSIINEITSNVVSQYNDSIRTVEVTLEIREDRVIPNTVLKDVVMKDLQWSLPDTISVKEVTLPKDPLRQALKNEVTQTMWSLEEELDDIQIEGVIDKLIDHDGMWAYIDETLHQLIKEVK